MGLAQHSSCSLNLVERHIDVLSYVKDYGGYPMTGNAVRIISAYNDDS